MPSRTASPRDTGLPRRERPVLGRVERAERAAAFLEPSAYAPHRIAVRDTSRIDTHKTTRTYVPGHGSGRIAMGNARRKIPSRQTSDGITSAHTPAHQADVPDRSSPSKSEEAHLVLSGACDRETVDSLTVSVKDPRKAIALKPRRIIPDRIKTRATVPTRSHRGIDIAIQLVLGIAVLLHGLQAVDVIDHVGRIHCQAVAGISHERVIGHGDGEIAAH